MKEFGEKEAEARKIEAEKALKAQKKQKRKLLRKKQRNDYYQASGTNPRRFFCIRTGWSSIILPAKYHYNLPQRFVCTPLKNVYATKLFKKKRSNEKLISS